MRCSRSVEAPIEHPLVGLTHPKALQHQPIPIRVPSAGVCESRHRHARPGQGPSNSSRIDADAAGRSSSASSAGVESDRQHPSTQSRHIRVDPEYDVAPGMRPASRSSTQGV